MDKRRIPRALAAVFLAAGLSAAGAATATAATAGQAHRTVTHDKPAKLDPFTGKLTTRYWTRKNGAKTTTYYLWEYAANTGYCATDSGAVPGTLILATCNDQLENDLWTTVGITTGDWAGYDEIESESGRCIDDPGGANNIQIEMETCAVVGGQTWADDTPAWFNAIAFSKGKTPYQAVTLDYGTVKENAWIVTNNYSGGALPTDMKWDGLG
jgi:hypothetical protein